MLQENFKGIWILNILDFLIGVFQDSPTDFTVDARAVTSKGEGQVTCTITNPSGNKTDSTVQSLNNGNYKVCYTPFEEGT